MDVLQHDVATYIDNTKPGVPVSQQRSGRAIKSISQRLKVVFLKLCNAINRQLCRDPSMQNRYVTYGCGLSVSGSRRAFSECGIEQVQQKEESDMKDKAGARDRKAF